MQKKILIFLLFLITLIIITPISSAFSFEKNYYVVVEDYELNESIQKEKDELFKSIENKIFNNNLCDKYYLRSNKGNLVIKVPFDFSKNNVYSNSDVSFSYPGAFHLYLYSCDDTYIYNFKFESEDIDNSVFSSRFAAYGPEYVYFNNYSINDYMINNLNRDFYNHHEKIIDRNSNLYEFIMINESGFTYNDDFCSTIGYYLINEFHPAIFSESHNEYLCNSGAYSLLNNHFLFANEMQGFFISDYDYNENYNFELAFESILTRKLAEKSIYRIYYNRYQTKNLLDSILLPLFRPRDKSRLYDIQSKNVNLQIPELLDLLDYMDNQLRVSEYNELAITRIDRKNEMFNWLFLIIGFVIGILSLKLKIIISSVLKMFTYIKGVIKKYMWS